MKTPHSTRQFLQILKKENELLEVYNEIDPHLELAELTRQVVAAKGKALLFHAVKGSRFRVATNLYGSEKRIELAFGTHARKIITQTAALIEQGPPSSFKQICKASLLLPSLLKTGLKKSFHAPVLENNFTQQGLLTLPQIKSWPEDGGAFITLPLVHTQSIETRKPNLGMYRIQMHNNAQCGVHMQIHRGGGFHHHEAEHKNQSLPVHIYIGGPPALTLAAILPLPEAVSELMFASLVLGSRLKITNRKDLSPLPILAEPDFCLIGTIPPHQRLPEGPFGDHYGYYSLKHDYPYMNIKHLFHRTDPVYPATIVGRPPQEDHYLTCYIQELLKPLITLALPQVKDLWAYEESGVHTLTSAIVKDRYPREALTTAFRILGEGHLSLTKALFVTDHDCDIKNFRDFFPQLIARMDFHKDLMVVSQTAQDTLDYTGPQVNKGSKLIVLGLGEKKQELTQELQYAQLSSLVSCPVVFCPGVLCVNGPGYEQDKNFAEKLAQDSSLQDWIFVFLFDDAKIAARSSQDFLWHAFTRFEPAADIHVRKTTHKKFNTITTPPFVFDCRLKSWYPKVLDSNPQIVQNVSHRFNTLITQGV